MVSLNGHTRRCVIYVEAHARLISIGSPYQPLFGLSGTLAPWRPVAYAKEGDIMTRYSGAEGSTVYSRVFSYISDGQIQA